MKRGKAQYSVEFLVTYGWAILVLGIIIAAVYTFGWFNPASILPQSCEFYGQVGCKDFYLSKSESTFNLSLINNFGENLVIAGMNITSEGETCVLELPNSGNKIPWRRNSNSLIGSDLSSDCLTTSFVDNFNKGDRVEIIATVYYFFNETCSQCENENHYSDDSIGGCNSCIHKSVGSIMVRAN